MMINNYLAPIALFVYNRPSHTQQTLEALMSNSLAKDSILYIYADGAKENADTRSLENLRLTRELIHCKQWCKETHIIESETNKGLADSIVEGVTNIINKHGRVIVLEDDIVTSPGFLQYMNEALTLYEKEEKVMHIAGFVPETKGKEKLPETYFLRFMSCWGWATWQRAWDKLILDTAYIHETIPARDDFSAYNLEGAVDLFSQVGTNLAGDMKTWAFKWYSTVFAYQGLCLYPKKSLVNNIGHDGSGEHCIKGEKRKYKVKLANTIQVSNIEVNESKVAKEYLKRFYIGINKPSRKERLYYLFKSSFLYPIYKKIRN